MQKEEKLWELSKMPLHKKLDNFPIFVRRQSLARFIARYELFKKILHVKGSIVECGVHLGGGLMTFAKLSANFEPFAIHRKIIGFDTFDGFPSISEKDGNVEKDAFKEDFDVYSELLQAIKVFDENRFLNQYNKVEIIKGDATITIPQYISKNPHLIVALLFLDFDLYESTKVALETFLPRIPKGGIVAFDELNNEYWKGETVAALETFRTFNLVRLRKFSFFVRKRIDVDKFINILDVEKIRGLDFGCGIGAQTRLMYDFGIDAYGVDISSVAIEKAIQVSLLLGYKSLKEKFILFSGDRIPFENDYFNITIAESVLDSMYFELAKKYIKEIERVTKNLVFLSLRSGDDDEHHREFCGEEIVKTLHENGTIQSYYNYTKILSLIQGTKFKIKWIRLIKEIGVNHKYSYGRYYLVLEKTA